MGGQAFELSAAQAEAFAAPGGVRRHDVWLPAGALTPQTLGPAVRRAVAELEILRTEFTVRPGGLDQVQVIADPDDNVCALLSAELTGEQHAILHLAAPATIADHRSLQLLAERLVAPPAADDDEPLQYVDFAAWAVEQQAEDTPDARVARAFWAPAATITTPAGSAALEAAMITDVPSASEGQWLLAWLLVLARQRLIDPAQTAITLSVAGRPISDLAEAVGPYARRLAVPFALDLDSAPADAARRVEATLGQAERHAVFGRPGPAPAAFSVFPAAAGDADFHRDAPVELRLVGAEPRRLGVACRTDLPVSAERLARQVVTAVRGLLAGDADRVGALALSDAVELEELARAAAGPDAPVAAVATVVHAFAARAAEAPQRVAVDDGTRQLTFAELAERTDRIAAGLGTPADADDAVLGVAVDRCVDTVVALLAVWKSGRAYVPVDPDAPPGRLADLLASAGCRSVLVTAGTALPELPGVTTVLAGDLQGRDVPPPPDASAPAYVLPTSGSTGTPKAVVVTHANALAYTLAITERLGLGPGQRYGALTKLNTDLAYTMLLPALAGGSTLRLFSDDEIGDVARLGAAVRQEQVDAIKLTPSLLRALLAGTPAPLPVPLLVFGGEALRGDLVAAARAAGAGRIVNHYGPTETTVGAVAFDVPPQLPVDEPVPIGTPLAGVRTYVLDEAGRPAPWGAVGELAIAGAGVAVGYRGDPPAAAAFGPEPGRDGGRMYRTGDLVRLDRSGRLLFLGRDDGQVKVRGHRVELAEIEHALRQADGVIDAAVVVDPHDETGGRLIAYATGPDVSEDLLAGLADRLPAHMVPARLVALPELPRTPSGKIDRTALPDPELYRPAAAAPTPPADEVERALLEIWAEVLQLSRLGTTDDFFQVGGHSLLATRIMARSRAHFAVDLPLHLIFTHSTVLAMATEVRARAEATEADAASEPGADELAAVLAELDSMSEEEARALLARADQEPRP